MRVMHIDPIFGISGDMMIGAMLDAGMPLEVLHAAFGGLRECIPEIVPVRKRLGIIEGTRLQIGESCLFLSVRDMEELIHESGADGPVKEDALAMLGIILDAEASVHGTTRDKVHLHELAHVDTLIDLLGVAAGVRYFAARRLTCGPLPHGHGLIRTAHGMIPNPPPVTLAILSDFPSVFREEELEMTTPTGAAIVRHYTKKERNASPLEVERVGYGIGSYGSESPDVLRLLIGITEDF